VYNQPPPDDTDRQPFAILFRLAMDVGLGMSEKKGDAKWTNQSLAKESGSFTSFSADSVKKWRSGYAVPHGDNLNNLSSILIRNEKHGDLWRTALKTTASRDREISRVERMEAVDRYSENRPKITSDAGDYITFAELIRILEEREREAREAAKDDIILQINAQTSDNMFPEVSAYEEKIKEAKNNGDRAGALRLQRDALLIAEQSQKDAIALAHDSHVMVARQYARLGALQMEGDKFEDAIESYRTAILNLPYDEVVTRERYTRSFWIAINSAAYRADTFEAARQLIARGRLLAPPVGSYSHNILILKTDSYENAYNIFRQMVQDGITPDIFSYNSLLTKVSDYEIARAIIDEMKEDGTQPDIFSYTIALAKANNYEEARTILSELLDIGLEPDNVFYNTLIGKAPDYEEARLILGEMRAAYVEPDIFSYNTLLNKARGKAVRDVLNEMRHIGVLPDTVSYNTLLGKAPDYGTARFVLGEMQAAQIVPDNFSYNTLLSKARGETIRDTFNEMRGVGVTPDGVSYNILISKMPDYRSARLALDEMRAVGVKPDGVSFGALISKAHSGKEARDALEEMTKAGIRNTAMSFNGLVSRAGGYEAARSVLEIMRATGVQLSVASYNGLLRKAPDYDTARAVLGEMQAAGVDPDATSYSQLIAKAPDYETAQLVLKEMRAAHVEAHVLPYNSLLGRAPDDGAARAVLGEMQAASVKPDRASYNSLLRRAADYDAAHAVFSSMQAAGIEPDRASYNNLLCKAADYGAVCTILVELEDAGFAPTKGGLEHIINLISSTEEAEYVRSLLLNMRLANEQYYRKIVAKLCTFLSGREILTWFLLKERRFSPFDLSRQPSLSLEEKERLPRLFGSQQHLRIFLL
jgi:pentatricopeptide repeat protein